jgi:hypothetical protein
MKESVQVGCLNLAVNPTRRWWQFWKPKFVWAADARSVLSTENGR